MLTPLLMLLRATKLPTTTAFGLLLRQVNKPYVFPLSCSGPSLTGEGYGKGYISSTQAPYPSARRKRQASSTPLCLLSPAKPLRWVLPGPRMYLLPYHRHRKERCPTEKKNFTARKAARETGLWRLLMPSVLGMCVCVLMLLGSTWAWFSASVSSGVSAVQSAEIFKNVTTETRTETVAGLNELSDEALLALAGQQGQTFAAYAGAAGLDVDAAQVDLALMAQAREADPAPTYEVVTVTLAAEGNVSTGYFAVSYRGATYYSGAVRPGEQVSFEVPGPIYAQEGEFAVEACWGAPPEDGATLEMLETVCAQEFDAELSTMYEQYLTALQKNYSARVTDEIGRAEEARIAEAERLAEENAAMQENAEEWTQEFAPEK